MLCLVSDSPARERNVPLHNDDVDAACVYHEVTKHSYTSVRTGGHYLDWDTKPLPYKIYPEIAGLALPRDLSLSAIPALQAISADSHYEPASLDLAALTRILFCSDGLTRRRRVGATDYHFRAAPSAGALYPIELYLAADEVEGLDAALYHFSPADLKLRALREGDWRAVMARAAAARQSIREARAVLIMSAIFWRSAWKYRARAYRYCFWDAGTMLANLLAAARAEELSAELVTAFADPDLERLIGIDGENEGLVCLVALGKCDAIANSELPRSFPPLNFETVPFSHEQVSYADIVKIHQASRLLTPEEAGRIASARLDSDSRVEPADAIRPALMAANCGHTLGETILRRGSTRAFARQAIPAHELATILALSSRHPRSDFPRLTDTYLIINAVEGITPGAYYYSRECGSFELLRAGDLRREAAYLCLEQPLGGDCSALVVYMADLERALKAAGNRGYRNAQLEAGILGGRAYLAAYALDRGATGLTFYDDDTTRFFEPHARGKSPMLMVALGLSTSRPAG